MLAHVDSVCCNHFQGASDRGGSAWVYEDGSTGLGPVPTGSGSGNAPSDPNAFGPANFGEAMQALLNHEKEREHFKSKAEGDGHEVVEYENVEITLSPWAMLNLWAMALLVLCFNAILVVRCMMRRKEYEVDVAERDYADSDRDHVIETDVDF